MTDRPDALAPLLTRLAAHAFGTNSDSFIYTHEQRDLIIHLLSEEVNAQRRLRAEQEATLATLREERAGWKCFHCGEVFTTHGAAGDHFGSTPESQAGCLIDRVALECGGTPERGRGLLMALRQQESALAAQAQEIATLKAEIAKMHEDDKLARIETDDRLATLKAALHEQADHTLRVQKWLDFTVGNRDRLAREVETLTLRLEMTASHGRRRITRLAEALAGFAIDVNRDGARQCFVCHGTWPQYDGATARHAPDCLLAPTPSTDDVAPIAFDVPFNSD